MRRSKNLQAFVLFVLGVVGLLSAHTAPGAVVPTAENLLPQDTLLVVSAPDFPSLIRISQRSSEMQFWNDPAMRLFKEHFLSRWEENLVAPLERELNMNLDEYASLLQGQLTFAVTQNDWQGTDDHPPGILLLLDARDKSSALTRKLASLRGKWADAHRTLRTEKIRGVELLVLSMTDDEIPATYRKFFPKPLPVQELGVDNSQHKPPARSELVIGQVDSLLILGNSTKVVEKVIVRLTGGSMPALRDLAAYQADRLTLFRTASLYGWVNAKAVLDILLGKNAQTADNPEAPNPFDLKPAKIAAAIGLAGIQTIAFTLQDSSEGNLFQFYFGVPESARQGIFRLFPSGSRDSSPPAFVPGDAARFRRWRLDGQQAWTALEKALGEIRPDLLATIKSLFEAAGSSAQEEAPGFELRKSLVDSLGDDLIAYERAPRGATLAESLSPPSLYLIGSPDAGQLAMALKSSLIFLAQTGPAPEREFLGRTIFAIPLPAISLSIGDGFQTAAKSLNGVASGGYVALSTDPSLLEEYLRGGERQRMSLRETPGLADAAQEVAGPGACLFGYENQAETMRARYEAFRKVPSGSSGGLAVLNPWTTELAALLGYPSLTRGLDEFIDPSLWPPFDKVSKYFGVRVYGASADSKGISVKVLTVTSPLLRTSHASDF